MPGEVVAKGPANAEQGAKGERKPRERKPRERKPIPEFEDPDAELKKVQATIGYKPDRSDLDYKIAGHQEKIDRDKRSQDELTRRIDAAKAEQQSSRAKGNAALEATREELRSIKATMLNLFQQRKAIAAAMDEVKSSKADVDAAVKKQRSICGRYNSEEDVDDAIRALETRMSHTTMSLQDEKACLRQIKDLNGMRAEVRKLQDLQSRRGANVTTGQSFDEMKSARSVIDGQIDECKKQQNTLGDQLQQLKDKYLPKEGNNTIGAMLDERKQLKDAVSKNFQAIKALREAHSKAEDEWYDKDRLVKGLKYQIKQRNQKLREERRAAAAEAGEELEEEDEEAGQMDYDVADRVVLCEQLIKYLSAYKPKEEVAAKEEVAVQHGADVDLDKVHHKGKDAVKFDDDLGLSMFYNENPTSKKKGKKDKKKAKRDAKQNVTTSSDYTCSLNMALETIAQFALLSIPAPMTTDDVDDTIAKLTEKAAYFTEHGKAGKTLKDIQKLEKASRKGKKPVEEQEEAAPAEEAAAPAAAPAKPAKKNEGPAEKNQAFVFIKPHAVTDAVKSLVSNGLTEKGITILSEGSISSEEIDEKKLIDQHYYAIASKATILKPYQLNVPQDKFEEQFEEEWNFALDSKKVYNAMDACHKLGISADELDAQWAICKKAGKMIKFGGGFYCGLIEIEDKDPIYVFNGFFMTMRSKFTAPGLSIYYYVVEFDANTLAWEDFRGQVLGPTNPADAPADSLRGKVMADWEALGLEAEPNVGDNGVHASASPLEGLAERLNWVGASLSEDEFGQSMLAAGISEKWITDGCIDPQVVLDADGTKGSLFDAVEDLNSGDCLEKLKELFALTPAEEAPAEKAPVAKPVEAEPAELNLDAARAAAQAKAAAFAASLSPEEQAIYGAKPQVAASAVREDSDSEDDGGADFVMGGEGAGTLLADY